MSDPTKHHYVSRCYLKAFGIGNKKNRRVRLIDLDQRVRDISHLTEIAASENFNRLELKGSSPVELEHLLGSVEIEAAPALDKLRKEGSLTNQGLDAAICFMSMFAARSPFVRNSLAEKLALHGSSPTEEIVLDLNNWGALNTGIPFEQVGSFLEMINHKISPSKRLLVSIELILSINIATSLKNRYWTMLDARGSGNEFVTSDRPVVIIDASGKQHRKDKDPLSMRPAFDANETLVHFPISPNFALQGAFEDFEYETVDAKLIASMNSLVVKQAGVQIYHHGKCFSVLDERCKMQDSSWILQN